MNLMVLAAIIKDVKRQIPIDMGAVYPIVDIYFDIEELINPIVKELDKKLTIMYNKESNNDRRTSKETA